MARVLKKLNDAKSEVIAENVFVENPKGLPKAEGVGGESGIVVVKSVPETRRIQFINGRDPGQELMFHYHSATHPLKHYTLFHGKEYDLPLEVIDHLENCSEKQYGYRQGPNGHPEMYTKGHKFIFSCKNVRKTA